MALARSNLPPPFAISFLVCDSLYADPATGKLSLLGVLQGIGGHEFPLAYPKICVYADLTDGRGRITISARLADVADELDPIFEIGGEANFDNPRRTAVFTAEIENAVFPAPGHYYVQLLADEKIIAERRFSVRRHAK